MGFLKLSVFVILLAPAVCHAQAKKIPVTVNQFWEGHIGQAVAFALKEGIQKTSSFILVDQEFRNPHISVLLISMDPLPVANTYLRDKESAIAITILYAALGKPYSSGIHIYTTIYTCGKIVVEKCAKDVLPMIDQAVEKLRRDSPELWKTL